MILIQHVAETAVSIQQRSDTPRGDGTMGHSDKCPQTSLDTYGDRVEWERSSGSERSCSVYRM